MRLFQPDWVEADEDVDASDCGPLFAVSPGSSRSSVPSHEFRGSGQMSVALEYGIPTDTAGLQLRLGIARGFFREEGIELSLRIIFGGPEIARAYDAGMLKIGELGTPPATTAIGRGAGFKIVASSVRRRALQYFF